VPAPPVASTSKGSFLPPTPLSQPPPAPKKITKTTKQQKTVPSKPLSAPSYEGLFDSDSDDDKKKSSSKPADPAAQPDTFFFSHQDDFKTIWNHNFSEDAIWLTGIASLVSLGSGPFVLQRVKTDLFEFRDGSSGRWVVLSSDSSISSLGLHHGMPVGYYLKIG